MKQIQLSAQSRTLSTKGDLSKLRTQGWVPAVIYGGKEPVQIVSVDTKQLHTILHTEAGENAVIQLETNHGKSTVMIKEVQRDILTHSPLHIDFQRISLSEKIEVPVPIHIVGEAPGVKNSGGILEHLLREVRVKCLPTEIPPHVELDISQLELAQGFHVKDLPFDKKTEVLNDPEQLVLHIVAPTVEEEAAPAELPVSTEPEVIAKGKKEEEAPKDESQEKKSGDKEKK